MGGASELGVGFMMYAAKVFNTSQLEAISAASLPTKEKGELTLIKGPPGTGKTTTLLGVLNALHTRKLNQRFKKILSTKPGELNMKEVAKEKPRLLVCAPSNAAVDNIIHKLSDSGFINGYGEEYFLGEVNEHVEYFSEVVRFGCTTSSESVEHYSSTFIIDSLREDFMKSQQG